MKSFTLGTQLQDIVSGVKGIATARTEFLNGCIQYTISPRASKPTSPEIPESYLIDADQLKEVGVGIIKKKQATSRVTGGPTTSQQAKRGTR